MPNAAPSPVRHPPGPRASDPRDRPDREDPRVARTTRALGRALIALVEERAFDAITVQDVLDRAGVGRTAFYAHYRNKHDVLHSSYDAAFSAFEPLLDRASPYGPAGARLFPVAEFLAHVGDVRGLVRALGRDGLLDDAWALLAGHAARVIERRLGRWAGAAPAGPGGVAHPLLARMLAGALVESVRWWQERAGAATPAEVDAAFHALARAAVRPRLR
jgi:AcrR family transcriptional regulator